MKIPIYQVDAFASRVFSGNPAAVCPLENWLPDAQLQGIALENNLAETAFFVKKGDRYHLRWFTPSVEVDLCGHATLTSAFVILNDLGQSGDRVVFDSRGGELTVTRDGDLYVLDFPSRPPAPISADAGLADALGAQPEQVLAARDYLVVLPSEQAVRALRPNMERLARIDAFGIIATAPGVDCDFVSRFFAPRQGVLEDPVTGSSHCTLIPYWSKRLGKKKLFGRQISERGGELWCEDRGERVRIAGKAVKFLTGTIEIAEEMAAS